MPDYLIKPYDVLFFRGNKSFHFGEWHTEGVFPPYPSTFQGFIRSKMLHDHNLLAPSGDLVNAVKAAALVGDDSNLMVDIKGPYLMNAKSGDLYFITPKDLFRKAKDCNICYSAFPEKGVPLESDQGFIVACPDIPKEKLDNLYPPEYVSMKELLSYRLSLKDIGLEGNEPCLPEDRVGIALHTEKLRSGNRAVEDTKFYVTKYNRLRSYVGFYFSVNASLKEGAMKLGSEAHLVHIEKLNPGLLLEESLKDSRDALKESITKTKTVRLVLLQHSIFAYGWMPFPYRIDTGTKKLILEPEGFGLGLELIFAFTEAPLKISGYSFAANKTEGKQKERNLKPQIKAVPAGSVYMLKIREGAEEAEVIRFIDEFDNRKIPYPPYSDMGFNHIMLACGAKIT